MKKLLTTILLLMAAMLLSAQNEQFARYSRLYSPEKLYLQTDREVYAVGDTIWFKGYLENANPDTKLETSNYIYVELLSQMVETNSFTRVDEMTEKVRARVMIKKWDDDFSGYIVIPGQLLTGIAVIRAYTSWMQNRSEEYMFHKNIELRNPVKDDVVLNMEKDLVRDQYRYTNLGVENPFAHKKKKLEAMDVQFLPESGRYFAGTRSVLGIKSISDHGEGISVSGSILADGRQIAEFETNRLGFGKVELNVPAGTSKLTAKASAGTSLSGEFNVPLPQDAGMVINLSADTLGVKFDISERGLDKSVRKFVTIYNKARVSFQQEYSDSSSHFELGTRQFPAGINNVAVVDPDGNVYAERAFFVFPHRRLESSFTTDKEEYGPRELAVCGFSLKDSKGRPVEGNFSVAVTDDSYAPYSGLGYNIESYMYLGSELKSFVEKSAHYFDTSLPLADRMKDADLLLMTQGWKYYDIPDILKGGFKTPARKREYSQSITGKLIGHFGRKAVDGTVGFVAKSIDFSRQVHVDTSGRFALYSMNFPERTKFIIGGAGKAGENKPYTPVLDEAKFPDIPVFKRYMDRVEYDIDYKVALEPEFYSLNGELVYNLTPAFIEAERTPPINVTPFTSFTFKPGQYRAKEELQAYEAYDVASYIITTCPGLRLEGDSIMCPAQRVASGMSISSGWQPIIIYINTMKAEMGDLLGLMMSDVEGFAYFRGADAMQFNDFGPEGMPLVPAAVVMFNTKFEEREPANVTTITPPGWQQPKRFYEPRYATDEQKEQIEGMRSTLHWSHRLYFYDDAQQYKFRFYTSEHKVPYTVTIEGITDDGEPVFLQGSVQR